MAEIFGMEDNYAANAEIDELQSERQTLIGLLIDKSGSMGGFEKIMEDSLNKFKSAVIGSKESDEMLISKTMFGSNIVAGGYQLIGDMTTDFSASGGTVLYDCIVDAQKRLLSGNGTGYMEKLQQNGIKTKAVIAIFTDGGKDYEHSKCSSQDARRAIEFLHSKEVIVAFVGFGPDATGVAQTLGIKSQNILETDATESDLRRIFTVLSKSAISASKSAGAGNSADSFFTV